MTFHLRRVTATLFFSVLPWLALSSAQAVEPPVLRLSLETEPTTLSWNHARSATDRFIVSFLMRGMLKYDSSAKITCDLCASYRLSPDGLTLTFELPSSTAWSDGVKLQAQHFVDSFRRLLDPTNRIAAAEDFKVIAGAVQPDPKRWDAKKLAVRAASASVLEITLTKPLSFFPHLLTTVPSFPIRKDLLRGRNDSGEEHATVASLGPYSLGEWVRGQRIVIEGNPSYTGPRPVYRVVFVLGKHQNQVANFKAGRIDILSAPTTEDLSKIPGQKVQVNPYWATRQLVPNVRRGPLADVNFRRALLHALDRDTLPAYLKSGERRVTGVIPPGLPGYRDLPLATIDANRAQAERGQAKVAAGKPVELELLSLESEADRRVTQWLSEQLEKLQIKLKPKPRPAKTFYADVEAGNFDLLLTIWPFEIASPLELLRSFQTHSPKNRGKWTHVAFDALVDQLFRASTPADFATNLDQASQILETESVGAIPVGYPTQSFLLGPRVVSFATTPFGDPDLVRIELKH